MSTHDLQREGSRLHYEVNGAASALPPLLLSHGYSASEMMWQENLQSLASSRQVITWDMRGHGRTVTEPDPIYYSHLCCMADMKAILDACGTSRAVVAGHSLGGYLSLMFGIVHPERVAALLLFDTGPGYRDERARNRWNAYAEGRAQAFDRNGLRALPDSPEVHRGPHDPRALALAARGILVQHSPHVIESLSSIEVPTLIVVGEKDVSFRAAADYMAEQIPGSVKTVIEGAGHAPNIDQPEAFNVAVMTFLKGLE